MCFQISKTFHLSKLAFGFAKTHSKIEYVLKSPKHSFIKICIRICKNTFAKTGNAQIFLFLGGTGKRNSEYAPVLINVWQPLEKSVSAVGNEADCGPKGPEFESGSGKMFFGPGLPMMIAINLAIFHCSSGDYLITAHVLTAWQFPVTYSVIIRPGKETADHAAVE